jgi:DegV family protein with EDD domain
MRSTCVVTDNTAQFTRPTFPGRNLVFTIPLRLQFLSSQEEPDRELKVADLPPSAQNGSAPRLLVPSIEDFRQEFLRLSENYSEIVAIFISNHLLPIINNAQEAANSVRGRVNVQIIDSQTTSVGLGILVQIAAEAATRFTSAADIERTMRGLIPHLYSVICIPGLTYLYQSGFTDYAQATVGEMLGLLPIFTLEEGHLTPLEKARNLRHLTDFFQEFLDEFSDLYHVAFIQSVPAMTHESRILREHALATFPRTPFSEHTINLSLAALFGPRCVGVIAMEQAGSRQK